MPELAAEANAKMPKDQELGGKQQTRQDEVLGTQDRNQGRAPRSLIPSPASLGKSFPGHLRGLASDRLYISLIPGSWKNTYLFF